LEAAKVSKYVFLVLLVVLAYLVFIIAQPFFNYIFMGLILTMAIYPFYTWFSKRIKNKRVSSIIAILLIILIIIIPSFFIVSALVRQTLSLINSFDASSLANINAYAVKLLGPKIDLQTIFNDILVNIRDFVVSSAVSIASSIAEIVLGLFIMFFIMYYGFVEGEKWSESVKDFMPFSRERREKLVSSIKRVTRAVIYGQVSVAILQGILGGIGFLIVGIKNPIFWGFIMTVLAFIPVLGTGLVWVPAGIIQILNNHILGGIFLLVYGFFIVAGIDNILKPKIISKAALHPIIALIGVLGGLKLFGFLGIIMGPIILALFITMAEFFHEDYIKEKH
jgi:predicted PurR-regulated permease PerM